jgi:hypothetical protein
MTLCVKVLRLSCIDLNGRNRYRACLQVQVEPRFEKYSNDDPIGFVVSKNLKRRHLNQSQLAFVALDIKAIEAERAKARAGGRPSMKTPVINDRGSEKGKACDIAAKLTKVSSGYVTEAERAKARLGGRPSKKTGVINDTGFKGSKARDIAADKIGVSNAYVTQAERIRHEAPDLEAQIMAGR